MLRLKAKSKEQTLDLLRDCYLSIFRFGTEGLITAAMREERVHDIEVFKSLKAFIG